MIVMHVHWLKRLWRLLLARLFGGPGDPYAAVRVPKRRSPSGRAAAAAVEEPREDRLTAAVSR
jgi:hypothetical protein